jgi:2-dehydro-3-deoxy-D-arabinonate dehydratase
MIKICQFQNDSGEARPGLLLTEGVIDLTAHGIRSLKEILEEDKSAFSRLGSIKGDTIPLSSVKLLAPVENQEVWAAGVTYLRSKKARMEESEFSASAYDKVYEAPRPELFFKSLAQKVTAPGQPVGIRKDARWNVPEPELALVINSKRELAGFTVGNDMSSRDIEGENLLYLPQAKIYKHSCALGPCITLGADEEQARQWTISIAIERGNKAVFSGQTSVNQIKRSFNELIDYLCRSQEFPNGVVLLTGTGIVPGDDFTLQPGDIVTIDISGIGVLRNTVTQV